MIIELITHDLMVNLIGATKTTPGLRVKARLDRPKYPTGVEVLGNAIQVLNLKPDDFYGGGN